MRKLTLLALALFGLTTANAAILFTVEPYGTQFSSVVGVTTETFDSRPLGANTGFVSAIGTYSGGGTIVNGDAYGGSNQSRYLAIGAQSGDTVVTLTLNSLSTYFGMYWPAVDGLNQLDFYQGATLLKSFTTTDIAAAIPTGYFGNPNNGVNTGERYVYMNFTSNSAGTNFDKIVFRNNGTGTGFETDSHSVLGAVPEPSTYATLGSSLIGLAMFARRRAKR